MSFGKRLKKLRTEKEITQLKLSEILDTAKSNISKYEADTIEPNITMLGQLSKYFNVSIDYLLGMTDSKLPYGITAYSDERPKLREDIGNSISYWVGKSEYGDDEIAKKLSISEELLDDYCSGCESMPLNILIALSEICEVSTDCLLGLRPKSRSTHDGKLPFQFDPVISYRLKELIKKWNYTYDAIADLVGVDEEEIFNFIEYGFLPHINTLIEITKLLNVSVDYLLNLSNSNSAVSIVFEKEYTALSKLNIINRAITYGDMLKLLKEQDQENYVQKTSSVAADDLKTGTDNMGK